MSNNFEIILKDFPKKNLDKFINLEILKNENTIISSNFYDNVTKKDLTIKDISSFAKTLSPIGCGSIVFSDFKLGISLGNTVITFSFDQNAGDIDINFEEKFIFLDTNKRMEILNKCRKIIESILNLKKIYLIPIILIGPEPADDKDMCLLKIEKNDSNLNEIEKNLFNYFGNIIK